jgi:hypothetical protein
MRGKGVVKEGNSKEGRKKRSRSVDMSEGREVVEKKREV